MGGGEGRRAYIYHTLEALPADEVQSLISRFQTLKTGVSLAPPVTQPPHSYPSSESDEDCWKPTRWLH